MGENDLNTLREALESAKTLMRFPAVAAGEVNLHATAIVNALTSVLSRLEAVAAAEYERGRQDGMKQEHAMWKLARLGQEIEAAAEPHPPTRHCMCASCRPSFDDNASPPAAIEGWRPSAADFAAWCDRHGMHHTDRAAFEDAATLHSAAPQPGDKALEEPAQVAPEHQAQVDQMAADAEARREKERGILLEAANHLEGDGHFMPAEDADWAAGWIRRQIGAGATP